MPILTRKLLLPHHRIYILILIILLFGSVTTSVKAQSIKYIKQEVMFQRDAHVKGKEQFSFGAGLVKDGINFYGAYGKYLTKDFLFGTDFIYETRTLGITYVNAYYVSPEINYCIDKISNRCFLDAKAGVVLGDETAHNKIMVNKELSNFVFGEKIGLKLEYFITSDISMNIDAEQRFINNSQIGTARWNTYLSLSYNF